MVMVLGFGFLVFFGVGVEREGMRAASNCGPNTRRMTKYTPKMTINPQIGEAGKHASNVQRNANVDHQNNNDVC